MPLDAPSELRIFNPPDICIQTAHLNSPLPLLTQHYDVLSKWEHSILNV